jgi:hypothetical protein
MDFFSKFNRTIPYPFYIKKREDIIHIHITKTAGTSLVSSMVFNRSRESSKTKKHYFAKEIIKIVGQEHWDNTFKFTFVRNPWDRLYSLYRFQQKKNKIASVAQGNTFGLWLKSSLNNQYDDPYEKLRPQVEWLKNFDNKIDIDFIGRFENLASDVAKLAQLLNRKIDLPHINQSLPIVHYSVAYDDELEELVRKHYKEDIEMFDYSFCRK